MNNRKVVAIGIDGGEFSVFERMIKKGIMPNLASMMKQSFMSEIDTSIQGPGQGWASFITGKSPERHGIYYWSLYKRHVNSSTFKDRCLWEILGDQGLRSCVINMSYTHPPRAINGVMIAGLGGSLSPSDKLELTYPNGLMDELRQNVGEYIPACDFKDGTVEDHMKLVQNVIRMTQIRTRTCLYMMDKYSPDFVCVVYRGADLIQHCFWNFLEPGYQVPESSKGLQDLILKYYEELDRSIGELWKKNHDSVKLIVSDHGFGPVKAIVYLNYYLAERRFLFPHKETAQEAVRQGDSSYLKKLYHRKLKKYNLFKKLNSIRKQFQGVDLPVDMSKTTAYCDAAGGVWLNKKLIAHDLEETKQQIMRCLRELKDPSTNQPVFHKVYLKEDCYAKKVSDSPDILCDAGEEYMVSWLMPKNDDRIFRYMDKEERAFFTGGHRKKGVLILDKTGLDISDHVNNINIADVSASIVELLGAKRPSDLDGRVFATIAAK